MSQRIDEFNSYLVEQQKNMLENANKYISEGREDDAVFLKIKANIYYVFSTLAKVSKQQANNDINQWKELFLQKAHNVPSAWKVSLEKAREFGDTKKIVIEESKLSTVDEIMKQYNTLFQE